MPSPGDFTLAICAIVKDENDYLAEWINYHLKTGVQHFFIYDNDSSTPICDTLESLDLLKYATVIKTIGKAMQVKAYTHCLNKFGSSAQWIAFIDVDEFMVAKTTHGNLPVFLKEYEDYGGLGMSWLVFGSNGHQQKSTLPQLESFTMRAEYSFGPNRHIKNIVQPRYTEKALGAHSFAYRNGKFCVNENFNRIDGSFSDVSVSKIQLNHYYCRSFEEYEAKIQRGYGDTSKKRTVREFFHHDKEANIVRDMTILELFND